MRITIGLAVIILVCGGLPLIAHAQETTAFNCKKNGAATASAGSTEPLRGPWVPVADYATELNTGLLVYKACVLDEIAVRQREAIATSIDRQGLQKLTTGNDGNPYFSREIGDENRAIVDATRLRNLQNDALAAFNDDLEGSVRQALAQGYTTSRNPTSAFACSYAGSLQNAFRGRVDKDFWLGFAALTDNPACSPLQAYWAGENALANEETYEVYKNMTKLSWGRGIYPVEHIDEFGNRITDTPGAVILANGIKSIQSGYDQLKAANDIGQIVGSLYAGVMNQVISGNRGLSGITESSAGQPSYLDRVVTAASRGLVTTTTDAAIAILQEALRVEKNYNAAVTQTAGTLAQTIGSLRSRETQCFTLITNAVCVSGSINGNKCTNASTTMTIKELTIATHTGFSQRVIDASIRALATATAGNLNTSNSIITKVGQLIISITGGASAAAQQAALAQLTALQPHNGIDVAQVQQDHQSIALNMDTVVKKATTDWADSTTATVGWCNVNNETVVESWRSCWSGSASACITP